MITLDGGIRVETKLDPRLGITEEQLKEMEEKRANHLGEMFNETKSKNPILLSLRFNHGFVHLSPFLYGHHGSFELKIDELNTHIHLSYIGVNHEKRRQGKGHEMLKQLTDIADEFGYNIDLDIMPKFGTTGKVLKKFYEAHGFRTVEDRSKKYMIRYYRGSALSHE